MFSDPPCWAISSQAETIRGGVVGFRDWKLAWVSRKCNDLAHQLARCAGGGGPLGFFDFLDLPEHI